MTMKTKNRSLAQKVFTETCRGAPLELRYYRLWEEAPDGPTRYGAAIEAVCNGDAGEPTGGDRGFSVIARNLPGFGRKTGRHGRGCLL